MLWIKAKYIRNINKINIKNDEFIKRTCCLEMIDNDSIDVAGKKK